MSEKTKNNIHLIYHILVSVMLVTAGLCLMVACVDIYRSGDRPFSRGAVAEAFSKIAVPVYFTLALMVAGFILEAFVPRQKKRRPAEKQYPVILEKLQKKLDFSLCDEEIQRGIIAERKRRAIHRMITLDLLAVGSIVYLAYGINPDNFSLADATGSMVKAMYLLLPCMLVPCGYGIFAAYLEKKSLQKEIELTRQAIAAGAISQAQTCLCKAADSEARIRVARLAIVALAICLIVYGAMSGGTDRVLTKAINICTECVGLG